MLQLHTWQTASEQAAEPQRSQESGLAYGRTEFLLKNSRSVAAAEPEYQVWRASVF